jgi:hypothetical protein
MNGRKTNVYSDRKCMIIWAIQIESKDINYKPFKIE